MKDLIHVKGKEISRNFIETSSGKIAYFETSGKTKPIILIHGNSCSKEFMMRQLDELGLKYKMIAIDLPGHGESDNARTPAKDYTVTGYACLVSEVIRKLNLEPVVVVGWSLGGEIAIEMMALFSNLLRGVVISGTSPIVRGKQGISEGYLASGLTPLLSKKEQFTDEDVIEYWSKGNIDLEKYPILARDCKRTHGLARKIMYDSLIHGEGVNEQEVVKTSPIPLGIIMGRKDHLINSNYIKSQNYANCLMIETIDGFHDCLWGNAKTFNKLLEEFVERIYSNKPTLSSIN